MAGRTNTAGRAGGVMRSLLRSIADGLLSVAFGVFMIALHFSLLNILKETAAAIRD